MYAFFQYDTMTFNPFHSFICLSGDFTKPLVDLFEEEVSLYNRIGSQKEVNMSLFLGVGSLEEDRFLTSYHKMKDSLISRQYTNFRLEGKIYPDHDHSSYLELAIKDGLIFNCSPWIIMKR